VRQARGGAVRRRRATHFIPPGIAGFEQAGSFKGPGFDFLRNRTGHEPRRPIHEEGGYPSGRYTGHETFTMVTENVNPGRAQAEVAQAQFAKLGFKVQIRPVSQATMYTGFCQVPKKKLLSCGDAAWFKDFNDPQSMLEPTFKGSAIQPSGGNNNLAQLNDPKVDAAMTRAPPLARHRSPDGVGRHRPDDRGRCPAVPVLWDRPPSLSQRSSRSGRRLYGHVQLGVSSLK